MTDSRIQNGVVNSKKPVIFTRDLKPGDHIEIPDHNGEWIWVTVISLRDNGDYWTISFRRDAKWGGRRDYIYAESFEEWLTD